ncbi:shikimate dehydrogenase [Caldalkalibacillus uzonensis]|uniref:Shikimate dehydrogenase (NADP(+)) n=1 Tax=Caldalkalibacillus uzonensis TaxID=353224 RepID=A0ABU0CU15_9BACI|nr:shikimate dehydrogenase [Caldalkalibacillus uzonensis]MDQ0339588.1 shikimate dehydrogenase [Caldalkalibacillus uzonensis]
MSGSEKQLFGLFAHPVGHSLSPVMHNRAFQALGLPYHYHPFDVSPQDLPEAVAGLKALGIKGINVTIPHKERIVPLLDELDPEAKAIGAVNTVVLSKQGRLVGYNTDGAGYVQSLLTETGVNLEQTRVLLLGAGGAAKAIAIYLIKNGCTSVTIANRTEQKAETLANHIRHYANAKNRQETNGPLTSLQVDVLSWTFLEQQGVTDYQLIINTTPVGMWPHVEQTPLALQGLKPGTVVSDIVYNPLCTAFLNNAKQLGATVHQGLGMFIYQGALAFKLFTGYDAPLDVMRQVVLKQLNLSSA